MRVSQVMFETHRISTAPTGNKPGSDGASISGRQRQGPDRPIDVPEVSVEPPVFGSEGRQGQTQLAKQAEIRTQSCLHPRQ